MKDSTKKKKDNQPDTFKDIADHYGVPKMTLGEIESVTFKPYYFKSKKIKASKEVKALFWPLIK